MDSCSSSMQKILGLNVNFFYLFNFLFHLTLFKEISIYVIGTKSSGKLWIGSRMIAKYVLYTDIFS